VEGAVELVEVSAETPSSDTNCVAALLQDLGEHRDTVNSASFSPDGQRVVTGGYDKVKLWFTGGSDRSKWGLLQDLGEHENAVRSVAFSPDGQRVVTGGYCSEGIGRC